MDGPDVVVKVGDYCFHGCSPGLIFFGGPHRDEAWLGGRRSVQSGI